MFKPNTSSAGLGKKKQFDGQFVNPPAYPDTSGFGGPGDVASPDGKVNKMTLEKKPSAKSGKV